MSHVIITKAAYNAGAFASEDPTRHNLASPWLGHVEGKLSVISTDGFRMGYAPVGGLGGPPFDHLLVPVLKFPRGATSAEIRVGDDPEWMDLTFLDANGRVVERAKSPRKHESRVPDVNVVLPSTTEAVSAIGVDAKYLAEAAKAVQAGSAAPKSGVKITFAGPLGPIKITADASPVTVIVMPMRL